DAAWQYFAHSFRRPTTRYYYHTETTQPFGIVRDDTIVESFGEEHLFNFKVKQIVPILTPDIFKGENIDGVQFEEKGALLVQDMTELVLRGCLPSRALDFMDRTLRDQFPQQ
ncbi:hypothetical protein PHYSODRAFT_466284, partial [Phytophthora sojae]